MSSFTSFLDHYSHKTHKHTHRAFLNFSAAILVVVREFIQRKTVTGRSTCRLVTHAQKYTVSALAALKKETPLQFSKESKGYTIICL